ncbi:hypothetical protein D3C87_1780100 [compost metagenome]
MQQVAVEGLLAENIHQLQTLRVFIFQICQRLAEHHALAAAVAVDKRKVAVRLDQQRAGDNRQHRRNAGPGGDRQIAPGAFGLRLVAKVALRHHDLQRHTLFDLIAGIAGETPAVDGFHRHANFARRHTTADGITAA